MLNNIAIIALVMAGLALVFGVLYVWFAVSGHRFHGAAEDLPLESSALSDASSGGLVGEWMRDVKANRAS